MENIAQLQIERRHMLFDRIYFTAQIHLEVFSNPLEETCKSLVDWKFLSNFFLQLTDQMNHLFISAKVRQAVMDKCKGIILQRGVLSSEFFQHIACMTLNQFSPLIQIDRICCFKEM